MLRRLSLIGKVEAIMASELADLGVHTVPNGVVGNDSGIIFMSTGRKAMSGQRKGKRLQMYAEYLQETVFAAVVAKGEDFFTKLITDYFNHQQDKTQQELRRAGAITAGMNWHKGKGVYDRWLTDMPLWRRSEERSCRERGEESTVAE